MVYHIENDNMTEAGANALINQLTRFWKGKAQFWKVAFLPYESGRHLLYSIRSNLLNGRPRDAEGD